MASDISIGSILGDRYEILAEVGRGRSGIVYKANHRRLEKALAVKVLFEAVGKDETSIKRFEMEAKSASRLNHPNIINVLDFGLSYGGLPYLVMEFLDGNDLHNVISTHSRLSLSLAVSIGSQICSALAHAHNRRVIHRDLKPSNIMLLDIEGYPEFVKLVDFGIAKRYDCNESTIERLTMEGQVLGTPAYMSPEQCQAARLDARSDIYSLGCLLFKMLTGVAPISGGSIIEIIHNHIGGEPLSFPSACPDVRIPAAIQEVVMTAMEKDPQRRHQSMVEFQRLLNSAFASCGIAAAPVITITSSFAMPGANPLAGRGASPFGAPIPFAGAQPSSVAPQAAPTSLVNSVPVMAPQAAPASPAPVVGNQQIPVAESDAVYKARKFETLLEAGMNGDSLAQNELSIRYQNGDGVDTNREEALKWLRAASQSGHKDAQYRLGRRLLEGDALLSSASAEGFLWCMKAAEQGFEPAQMLVATCFEEGRGAQQDLLKAVHYYRQSMKQGNQHANARLAACYKRCFESGLQAEGFVEWVEARAAEGDVEALYVIACSFSRTDGGAQLSKQAIPHLLTAAQQGNLKAQVALARAYISGNTPDDGKQAVFWLSKAAELGSKDALVLMAMCAMNGFGTSCDPVRSVQLLQQAADTGNLDAQAMLGSVWLIGDNVPRNLTRGIQMLRAAANSGSSFAQWKLALCLKNGVGILRDAREAEKWFDKASEGKFDQGPPWRWTAPGLRFDEVIQTFQNLASLEHRQAHYWLGICYEQGIGVPRDLNKALELYMKSANKGFQPALEAANKLKAK